MLDVLSTLAGLLGLFLLWAAILLLIGWLSMATANLFPLIGRRFRHDRWAESVHRTTDPEQAGPGGQSVSDVERRLVHDGGNAQVEHRRRRR